MNRRTFLAGSAAALVAGSLAACTGRPPRPSPTTASPAPSTPPALPQPAAFRRTAWTTDPFARGAASYYAVGSSPADREALAESVDGRVFFAGEAVSQLPGTIAGALVSGREAAGRVLDRAGEGERIAVIGAGAAGITAARMLADRGLEVVVIEARERLGGRIATSRADDWPFPIELGAGVVREVPEAPIVAELERLGVESRPYPAEAETRTPAGDPAEQSSAGPDAVAAAVAWAAGQPRDVSLAQALVDSGAADVGTGGEPSDADWLQHYLVDRIAVATAAPADALSSWYGVPTELTGDDRLVLGGLDAVVAAAAEGLEVATSSAVTRVAHNARGVSLRLGNGQSLTVDRVVVTVPLGVLKAGAVEFEPPLPFGHRAAIDALGFGALEKVWLRFDRPFWTTTARLWRIVPGTSDFAHWLNLLPVTGEPVLVGVAAAAGATRLAELSDDEVLEAALLSLAPFAGAS